MYISLFWRVSTTFFWYMCKNIDSVVLCVIHNLKCNIHLLQHIKAVLVWDIGLPLVYWIKIMCGNKVANIQLLRLVMPLQVNSVILLFTITHQMAIFVFGLGLTMKNVILNYPKIVGLVFVSLHCSTTLFR